MNVPQKPMKLIDVSTQVTNETVDEVVNSFVENKFCMLNVAGNRESQSLGVEKYIETFLIEVFKKLG